MKRLTQYGWWCGVAAMALWSMVGCAPALYSPDGDPQASVKALLGTPTLPLAVAQSAPPVDLARLEQAVSEEVNKVRAAEGLVPLRWNDPLAQTARAYSADMASEAFFAHQAPDGSSPGDRAQRDNLSSSIGENIYLAHRFREYRVYPTAEGSPRYEADWRCEEEIARHAVATWLESPSHRANLLSPVYEAQAIGAAVGEGATVFITQNLMPHRHAAR